jgi:hypothetical protein
MSAIADKVFFALLKRFVKMKPRYGTGRTLPSPPSIAIMTVGRLKRSTKREATILSHPDAIHKMIIQWRGLSLYRLWTHKFKGFIKRLFIDIFTALILRI